ncbi:hypothetical protein QD357_05845 [Rhizobium sp. BR 317]|uniref:hypothetical protein n=1 Tax=Rhizobium sp. BR 317 TaxID=3040015 RepID=UPI0039BF0508
MSNDDLTTFTPGEVEAVTGLSTVMQRNWRRHGYLPATKDGHARFNAFEMARLMVMRMFSDRGIGPSESFEIAGICSVGIVYSALQERMAYNANMDLEALRREHIDLQSISRRIIREYTGAGNAPAQYFIWWADGTHVWHRSLSDAFPPSDFRDPRTVGLVMLLDLNALGRELLAKIRKPIAHV